jgi:hypothetical protein
VEVAALLYQGEYIHARHAVRRWTEGANNSNHQLLKDWYDVLVAMMTNDSTKTLWRSLQQIQTNHPTPMNNYATDVATSYRRRLLLQYQFPTQPMIWSLLNFGSIEECQEFCHQQRLSYKSSGDSSSGNPQIMIVVEETPPTSSSTSGGGLMKSGLVDRKASLTQVVTFLESIPTRTTAGSTLANQ